MRHNLTRLRRIAASRLGSLGARMSVGAVGMLLLSVPLLHPSWEDVSGLVLLAAACLFTVGVLTRVWGRSSWARPAAAGVVLASLAVTSLVTDGLGSSLSGAFTLVFVYVGLSCPRRTTPFLLGPAAVCWLATNAPMTDTLWARLPVAVGIWALLGELLAWKRQEAATLRKALALEAQRDALTGLDNRHGMPERVLALQPGDAVVFLDLDHFKKVNDLFGHAIGDAVLRDLGRVVLSVLREHDQAVRYGGEEVLLFLRRAGADGADRFLTRLTAGWSASHPEMTFSAGISVVDAAGGDAALNAADQALYLAKAGGRNQWVHAPAEPGSVSLDATLDRSLAV